MSTEYQPADVDHAILRKLLTVYGGTPVPGDTEDALLRKILTRLNEVGADELTPWRPGDKRNDLLRKILTRLANDAVFLGADDDIPNRAHPGDLDSALLRKIVVWVGGSPQPGDTFNALLRKYLTRLNTPGDPI